MSEMTAREYFKIKERMTEMTSGVCRMMCVNCPLSSYNNKKNLICRDFEIGYPDEAMAIAEKWNKEHPPITNAEHYVEELRKIGYNAEVEYIQKTCPVHKNASFTKSRICNDANDCKECKKWWDEEYVPAERR